MGNVLKPICFIPARGSSKGIPRKNIKKLGNKPLIVYTIETALESKIFEHVIVNTDDKEIAQIAKQYGAEVPFMRPKYLAGDKTGYWEVLIHAIKKLFSLGYKFNSVVSRDCTVPFITKHDLREAYRLYSEQDCDGVHTVCLSHPNPYFGMFEKNSNGFLLRSKISKKRIADRQSTPKVYEVNGVYINSVKKVLQTKDMFKGDILPYEISQINGFMIDSKLDFFIAEQIIKSIKKNNLMIND